MNLTAIIEKSEDGWYVGQIEEFPAAISQAKTIDELKANLIDAFMLLLETNKETINHKSSFITHLLMVCKYCLSGIVNCSNYQ